MTSAVAQDLEEEILGDVEPVTEDKDQDKVEDQDITDKVKQNTNPIWQNRFK